jgi:AraC family transcriptional regulator, regulatory protein of adaptative response / methylated-DNA-[protein]-cysteine methyltransferase
MAVLETTNKKTSPVYWNDEDRWAAVAGRDRNADGSFYYSVETTGVYCRPSCAARLPRRENVRFHLTCEAAERAGFRPCRRCRPSEPALMTQRASAIEKACRVIESADELPNLDDVAAAAGMSRFHFQRVFKSVTGVTPGAYFTENRAHRVRTELTQRETVTEAIYSAGFNSNGRFYESSSQVLGMTPTNFRSGGEGTTIRFAVGQCSLGAILVGATDRGVCSILLGDDPDALVHDLESRFPKAQLIGGDKEFEQWVAKVVGLVEAPRQGFDLPVDVRGTAFQQRVWKALKEIPAGSTASYTDIAARIGAPKAVRAVAQACASNSIAVAIPCHRVVRNDGALSGYRWGVERKRALLKQEAAS